MSFKEAWFWIEASIYDTELTAEAVKGEERVAEERSLDDLIKILPKSES